MTEHTFETYATAIAEVERLRDINADMLAALREARDWFDIDTPDNSEFIRELIASGIAKAEGKTPTDAENLAWYESNERQP